MSFADLMEVFRDVKRKYFSAMIFEASLSEINWGEVWRKVGNN
jgi:hypothetical protein